MLAARRKDDMVIAITQRNDLRTLLIDEVSPAIEQLFQLDNHTLKGTSLISLFPPSTADIIQEEVTFEPNGRDIADVLSRMVRCQLQLPSGETFPVKVKPFSTVSDDAHPHFELLMRDARLINALEGCKQQLAAKRAMYSDSPHSLISSTTLLHDILVVKEAVGQYGLAASLLCIQIEGYYSLLSHYGKEAMLRIIQQFGAFCIKNCREEDRVAYVGDGIMGLLLFHCTPENGSEVFNRINTRCQETPFRVNEIESLFLPLQHAVMGVEEISNPSIAIMSCKKALG